MVVSGMSAGIAAECLAVKRRHKSRLPNLWLLTDQQRCPNPLAAILRLPRHGRAGVLIRHHLPPDQRSTIIRLCHARGIALVIAGATESGAHLRGGRWHDARRPRRGLLTASAHNQIELQNAMRRHVDLVFLSPAFATSSHPGARPLGSVRWARLARSIKLPVLALGGIQPRSLRRLGRFCAGAGGIGLFNATED